MSPDTWRKYAAGTILTLLGVGVTVSLLLSGRLTWYVHPRYVVFTAAMVALAAVALVAAAVLLPPRTRTHDEHRHEMADPETVPRRGRVLRSAAGAILLAAAALVLLVLPPAVLSDERAVERTHSMERQGEAQGRDSGLASASAPDGELSVLDWALLLRQHDPSLLAGRAAIIQGFVTPDVGDPESVFLLTRFAITCCAVDAEPVVIPVYSPGWQQEHEVGEWLEIEGVFAENPSVVGEWATALIPRSLTRIAQPEDPYVG